MSGALYSNLAPKSNTGCSVNHLDRVKRIWYLSPMRAVKVQASLCIRAVSPEPLLLAHTSSESRGTFRQKARSLAPLNGWACAVEICHDGMLEDTNLLDGAHFMFAYSLFHDFMIVTLFTGTQLLIAIIDAWSIANAYYYGVSYARPGLLQICPSTSCALER